MKSGARSKPKFVAVAFKNKQRHLWKQEDRTKEKGSTSFKNNQRHLFENKNIEQKNERGSTSGAGDLPGCQLEANCPGPEEVDYQNIDSCESLVPEEVDYQG